MASTPIPHTDPRYGFYQTATGEDQWVGDYDHEFESYTGVWKPKNQPFPHNKPALRRHTVWAKDELEAFMRLTARRNASG